ncbi:MAG: hypothetical protein AAF389_12565 [Gemmatimonadota bacterium]
MRIASVLSFAVMLPGTLAAQTDTTSAPEEVALRFGWPVGMTASVTGVRYQEAIPATSPSDTSRVHFSYDVSVHDDPHGLRIHFENFDMPGSEDADDVESRLMSLLGSASPDYFVSPDGELLDIGELDETIEIMKEFVGTLTDSIQSEALEEYMGQAMSPEVLYAQAAEQWNALVGTWIEAVSEVGMAYELDIEQPLPMLGNALVPFTLELGTTGWLPCSEDEASNDCVELILRSFPNPELIREHVADFTQRLLSEAAGSAAPQMTFEDLEIENEVILIAEPEGLIPHRLTITQSSRAVVEMAGIVQEGGQIRIADFVYDYGSERRER